MAKPYLPNLEVIAATGIAPGVGAVKSSVQPCKLKEDIQRLLRVKDRQEFTSRYEWYGLPDITGEELERILYYKGQIMAFYMESNDTFYYLPYALDGDIDVYGRYKAVTPVPMGATDGKAWIKGLNFEVCYETPDYKDEYDWATNCVKKTALLKDYGNQLAQNIVPRAILQDSLIAAQAEVVPFMRTAMINSTGVAGMRVNDEDSQANVKAANAAKVQSALNGDGWIPVVGQIDFQNLDTSSNATATEFLQCYQAIDNLRSGFMGIGSGAAFQKNEHMLEEEMRMNQSTTDQVLQDGLYQRQRFCTIFNGIFGTTVWCEIKGAPNMAANEMEVKSAAEGQPQAALPQEESLDE